MISFLLFSILSIFPCQKLLMEFPEEFNQLELLDTHGHLIPRGASSQWTGSHDDEEEEEEMGAEDEEQEHIEEWYLQKEEALKDMPEILVLWAAENNRVSDWLLSGTQQQQHARMIIRGRVKDERAASADTKAACNAQITMFFSFIMNIEVVWRINHLNNSQLSSCNRSKNCEPVKQTFSSDYSGSLPGRGVHLKMCFAEKPVNPPPRLPT